jgi:tetratricopeptide (TPR) repeat protein
MPKALGSTILALIVWCASAVAVADMNPMTEKVARKHYELGSTLYDTSNYPGALAEFEKAYKLEPKPALLFNIARCYEVMAKLEQAIKYYKLFLAKSDKPDNEDLVRARLATLERRLKEERPRQPEQPEQPKQPKEPQGSPPPEKASPAGSTPPAAPKEQERGGSWRGTAGWVLLGVGGASLATGVVFGVLAGGKTTEYNDGVGAGKTFEELDAIDGTGKSFELAKILTLVIGGVAAAAGGGLLLWNSMSGSERDVASGAVIAPYATTDGAGLVGRVSF